MKDFKCPDCTNKEIAQRYVKNYINALGKMPPVEVRDNFFKSMGGYEIFLQSQRIIKQEIDKILINFPEMSAFKDGSFSNLEDIK
jgi:hypothetical protein